MSEPTVCPRCVTEGCPAEVYGRVPSFRSDYEALLAMASADRACSLRLLARIQEAGLACECAVSVMAQCPRHGRF